MTLIKDQGNCKNKITKKNRELLIKTRITGGLKGTNPICLCSCYACDSPTSGIKIVLSIPDTLSVTPMMCCHVVFGYIIASVNGLPTFIKPVLDSFHQIYRETKTPLVHLRWYMGWVMTNGQLLVNACVQQRHTMKLQKIKCWKQVKCFVLEIYKRAKK